MGSLLSHFGRVAALVDDGDAAVRIAHRDVGHAVAVTATEDGAARVVLDRGEMHAGAERGLDAMQIAGATASEGGRPASVMPVQNGIPSSMSGLGSGSDAGRARVCPSPSLGVGVPGNLSLMPSLVWFS